MGLSNGIEPDPEFDFTLDIELRRNHMKQEVLRFIEEGTFSSRRLMRKLYDPDDPHFSKIEVLKVIHEVQLELREEFQKRSILDEVVAFLDCNEELIENATELVNTCDRPRDKVAALNTVGGLWKDRMAFLKDLGAKFDDAINPKRKQLNGSNPEQQTKDKQVAEFTKAADAIEAEFEEIPTTEE